MQTIHLSKKVLRLLLAILVLPSAASAETILRYSDHQPLDQMRTTFLKEVLFPAIEQESNGRLKIEDHWDGELAAPYYALDAVSKGDVTDIATAVPEYTADDLPLHQIFKSFPVGPSGDEQVSFFRRVYAEVPEFSDEFADNNVVPIFLGTGFPVAFYSVEPLASLDEIAGTTWRSASFWHLDFLGNTGAEAVRIPWGQEVYDAFAARTLDGLMVNVDSGYNLKVYEQAPNVLVSENLWLGHLYPVVMNRDTWNGLAQEDKDAIQRAAETAYAALGAEMDRSFDAQLEELVKLGAKVRTLDTAEVEAFSVATRYPDVQAAWVSEQENSGVSSAGHVVEKVSAILQNAMD
jgi:TRAP-type C4-dicarboxylate transport system substrate-binding protein